MKIKFITMMKYGLVMNIALDLLHTIIQKLKKYFFHGYGDINLLKFIFFLRRFKIWLENKLNEIFSKKYHTD